MNGSLHQGFQIGEYRVEPGARLLCGPGGRHRLCLHTAALLEMFAENAGRTLARDRILKQVWHDNPAADRALTRCVSGLRRSLGDRLDATQYIETVPHQGYRLIAPVRLETEAVVEERPAKCDFRPIRANRAVNFLLELRQRKVCRAAMIYAVVVWLIFQVAEIIIPALHLPDWALGFVVVTGILGFPIALILAWIFEITPTGLVVDGARAKTGSSGAPAKRELVINCGLLALAALISCQLFLASSDESLLAFGESSPAGRSGPRTLIVMPFTSAGSTPASNAISIGLADELRHLLRRERGMKVIAWDLPGGSDMDPRDHADVLLQGSLNADYDPVRVTIRLADPRTGYDIWSTVLEEPGTSSASLQKGIARKILAAMPFRPDGEELDPLYASATTIQ